MLLALNEITDGNTYAVKLKRKRIDTSITLVLKILKIYTGVFLEQLSYV